MASRAYFIPGWGYINETKAISYFVPGWGYINQTATSSTALPYILGSSMVQTGTSILLQGTSPLINKGTVRDPLNTIPH